MIKSFFFSIKTKLFDYLILFIFILFFLLQYSNILDIRFATDDVCRTGIIDKKKFGYILEEYFNWDGRFTFKLIFVLFYIIFNNYSPIFTAFFLLLLFFTIFIVFFVNKIRFKFFYGFILFTFYSLFLIEKNWFRQVFFNKTLSLTYFLPSIFIFYLIFVNKKSIKNKLFILLNFILTFSLTGYHEIFSVFLILVFCVNFLISFLKKNKINNTLFFLIASMLGFFLMYIAPGNNMRSSYFTRLDFFNAFKQTIINFFNFGHQIFDLSIIFSDFYLSMLILIFGIYFGVKNVNLNFDNFKFFISIIIFFIINLIFTTNLIFLQVMSITPDLGGRHTFFIEFTASSFYFFFLFFIGITFSLFLKIKIKNKIFNGNKYKNINFIFKIIFFLLIINFISKNYMVTKDFFDKQKFYADYFDSYVIKAKKDKIKKEAKIILPNFPIALDQFSTDKNNWTFKCLSNYVNKKIYLKKIN